MSYCVHEEVWGAVDTILPPLVTKLKKKTINQDVMAMVAPVSKYKKVQAMVKGTPMKLRRRGLGVARCAWHLFHHGTPHSNHRLEELINVKVVSNLMGTLALTT